MNKRRILLVITTAITVMLLAVLIGTVGVTAADIVNIILHKLFRLPLRPDLQPNTVSIIWTLRLPRVLLAFLVGAALGASGTLLSSKHHRPHTLGVSSEPPQASLLPSGFAYRCWASLQVWFSPTGNRFVIALLKVDKVINTIIWWAWSFPSLLMPPPFFAFPGVEGIIMWQISSSP